MTASHSDVDIVRIPSPDFKQVRHGPVASYVLLEKCLRLLSPASRSRTACSWNTCTDPCGLTNMRRGWRVEKCLSLLSPASRSGTACSWYVVLRHTGTQKCGVGIDFGVSCGCRWNTRSGSWGPNIQRPSLPTGRASRSLSPFFSSIGSGWSRTRKRLACAPNTLVCAQHAIEQFTNAAHSNRLRCVAYNALI